MSSSNKRDFRDPKQFNDLWQLLIQKNSKSNLDQGNSICHLKRHGNLSSKANRTRESEVHGFPSSKGSTHLIERGVERDLRMIDSKMMMTRSCRNDNKALFKSKTNEKSNRLSVDLSDTKEEIEMGASSDICAGESCSISKKSCDCYESRMFSMPYINQLTPRLPSFQLSSRHRKKNVSEYTDEIGRVGLLITKYKLHDHSKCGKQGRKCEHIMTVEKN